MFKLYNVAGKLGFRFGKEKKNSQQEK
jgi:hypothetical protein